jgi:type IV pilus assembly protein PilB|nr:hypothetical protein [Kofleriaceae bacterium]
MARKKLGELLVDTGVISEATLRTALGEQRRWGGSLGRTLVEMKAITEEALVAALSQQFGVPPIDLDQVQVQPAALEHVHADLAQQWSLVPIAVQGRFLDVAMGDPTNLGIVDELRIRTQLNIRTYVAGPKALERAIRKYYKKGFDSKQPRDQPIEMWGGDVIEQDPGLAGPPTASASGNIAFGGGNAAAAANAAQLARDGIRPYPRNQGTIAPPTATSPQERDAEIAALQIRLSKLEALVSRDEDVIRKLMALLIEKGVASRDEILDRLR